MAFLRINVLVNYIYHITLKSDKGLNQITDALKNNTPNLLEQGSNQT